MSLRELKAGAQEKGINLYSVRKDPKGGYNITSSVQINETTQTAAKKGFVMAGSYKDLLNNL